MGFELHLVVASGSPIPTRYRFMNKVKLIVKTESANLWWGIHGFCEKAGWEDLSIFHDDKKIGAFCLNTKQYLRSGVEDLRDDPGNKKFVEAADNYLADQQIHYWFYYYDEHDDNFYEVPYDAPRNDKNEKPRYLDLWHPDESIDISTIQSAVKHFAQKFLKIDEADIEIEPGEDFNQSLQSYREHVSRSELKGKVPGGQ
jgi:hypothetical protein